MAQNLVLPALENQNSSNKSLPKFVKAAPPHIQSHLVELIQNMPSTAQVIKHTPGVFTVIFPDSREFKLTFGNELQLPSCECPEWHDTRMLCRHFCIIFSSFPGFGWSKLSVQYINHPIFAVDKESLPAEIQTLFKVDGLQQQAEMTQTEVEVRQETVEGEQRMETDDDTGIVVLFNSVQFKGILHL